MRFKQIRLVSHEERRFFYVKGLLGCKICTSDADAATFELITRRADVK